MHDDHVDTELSAYIDGNGADRHKIARHLQSCPECARRHLELLKVSHAMRAMVPIEATSQFTEGVMARISATKPLPRWRARLYTHTAPRLAMAASLLLVALGAWYGLESQKDAAPTHPSYVANEAWLNDENVIAAVEDLSATDDWVDTLASEDVDDSGEFEVDLTVDALMESLAESSEEEEIQAAWYEPDDLLSVIELLAEEDVETLVELTQNHWDEV